jgi:hypothetical protein
LKKIFAKLTIDRIAKLNEDDPNAQKLKKRALAFA